MCLKMSAISQFDPIYGHGSCRFHGGSTAPPECSSVASPGAPGFRTGGRWAHESQPGKSQWTLCASDGLGPIYGKGGMADGEMSAMKWRAQKSYEKVRKMLKV